MESQSPRPEAAATLTGRYPGFVSFKTCCPILYQRRWIRDALIQGSLDNRVLELAPAVTPFEDLPIPAEFCFRQRVAEGLRLVFLTQDPTTLSDQIDDARILVVDRVTLARGARAQACRAIWAHKRSPFESGDLYRAVELVARSGTARMSEIVAGLHSERHDPVHQVFSFLANGFLTAELERGIWPSTTLRLGPAASSA